MNILYIDKYGISRIVTNTDVMPSIGQNVDWEYKPAPTINTVLLHPSIDTIRELLVHIHIDIIVTLK